jgi:hypothetical protein
VYAGDEKNLHTPGIGLITKFYTLAHKTRTNIQENHTKSNESFTYDTTPDAPK